MMFLPQSTLSCFQINVLTGDHATWQLLPMRQKDRVRNRFMRTSKDDDALIEELLQRFPTVRPPALLQAALSYGLRAAKERPAEVLLGESAQGEAQR